ncbi:unnamed protein product [Phytophthora fragariaefolia]|uniref:Unnamed protein product n=1 Tax=Phytophthora fragariaefolia TaxID=1490495 RepID=A0A9W6Y5L1_9STRA|nr:unnamed protein product [Phytophthora fragariaefolia]
MGVSRTPAATSNTLTSTPVASGDGQLEAAAQAVRENNPARTEADEVHSRERGQDVVATRTSSTASPRHLLGKAPRARLSA